MEFWNQLSEALKQKGFSAAQVQKLKSAFGALDAAGLLRMPPDQLLPATTGRTVAEKREKIETLLATVREVQAAATGRPSPARPPHAATSVSFTIRFIEVDAQGKPPLRHERTEIELLDAHGQPVRLLFRGRSDAQGTVTLVVPYPDGQPAAVSARMTLRGVDGQSLHQQALTLDPKKPETIVEVQLAAYRQRLAGSLDEWQQTTRRRIPPTLNALFARERVTSLADIRRSAKKLASEPGLGGPEKAVLDDLIAHADLQVLSRDAAHNQALLGRGFRSIFDIAPMSRAAFVEKVKTQAVLAANAGQIYQRAVNQVQFLKNIAVDKRVAQANGFTMAQTAAEPQPCACDCQSAVSPLAYLVDLLDFVLREAEYDGGELTLSQLQALFHQPLSALPADCSASTELVRQVRICVEVLRHKALTDGKADAADAAAAQHAVRAYEALLNALGTSSRELRLLRGAPDADRSRKAQALGIAVEHLNDLLLTPTEPALETIFGLQDTSREPLSFSVKTGDDNGRIQRWRLQGVAWQGNTSEDGRIFARLQRQGNQYIVTLFKDAARANSQIVARGEAARSNTPNTSSKLQLKAENGSGLTGAFLIDRAASGTINFELQVVPKLLIWRFLELNGLWETEDHPELIYDTGLPLIDPDMLTEAHFCRPLLQNPAHSLWSARTAELHDKRNEIDPDAMNPRTVNGMLKFVWPANPPDWDGIVAQLQDKDAGEVEKGTAAVKGMFLTVDAFNFLNDLRRREDDEAAATAPGNPAPTLSESEQKERASQRETALDILVNVVKRRDLYSGWLTEEQNQGISLTQRFFCLPAMPVTHDRPLRVVQDQYVAWLQQLTRNSQSPVVDPDVWHPLPNIGLTIGPVETMRQQRRDQLKAMQDVLQNLPAAQRTQQWLDDRLGATELQDAANNVVLHALGFANLDALQQAFDSRTLEIWPQQHGLTTRELVALFTLRKLVATDQADEKDWQGIFHILIQTEKRRYLHPAWRAEETALKLTLSPKFFRHPDQSLLQLLAGEDRPDEWLEWRGDSATLRAWRSKLKARYEQRAAVTEGLRAVVDSAEEATLPALRDALIGVLYDDPNGNDREQHKRDAANALLINTFESGCRKTTRVAQAIETMQLLVWGILNRQIEDAKFAIPTENQDAFEATWRWLRSYATWRAAILVFLYPENVLYPALLPEQGKTLVFQVFEIITNQWTRLGKEEAEDAVEGDWLTVLHANEIAWKMRNDLLTDEDYYSDYWLSELRSELLNLWYVVDQSDRPKADLENHFFIPISIALYFQKRGRFENAIRWYREVFGFASNALKPHVADRLDNAASLASSRYYNAEEWLTDQLNPHLLASTRVKLYERFILLSIIRCLLEYAEAEFSADTSESLARARELYFTAQRMLDLPELKQHLPDCEASIGKLILEVGERFEEWNGGSIVGAIIDTFPGDPGLLDDPQVYRDILAGLDVIVNGPRPGPDPAPETVRAEVIKVLETHLPTAPMADLRTKVAHMEGAQLAILQNILRDEQVFDATQQIDFARHQAAVARAAPLPAFSMAASPARPVAGNLTWPAGLQVKIPGVLFEFCIPPNSILIGLRLRTEVGLYKLNNCMNLAGLRREVPVYAAPTDAISGLPGVGISGAITLPGAVRLQGTQYRYKVLVERAKQLVNVAQQMEASYLSFLDKFDQESYTILRARQDLDISKANIALQELRLTEAGNGMALADVQGDKVSFQESHFTELLEAGFTGWETGGLWLMGISGALQGLAAAGYFLLAGPAAVVAYAGAQTAAASAAAGAATSVTGVGAAAGAAGTAGGGAAVFAGILAGGQQIISGLQAAAGSASTFGSLAFQLASFERRYQEWEFQHNLAEFEVRIAEVQKQIAQDRYDIVQQEQTIAQLSADNAADVVNFLDTKFTNAELYSWMSGVIGETYRYFLVQATAVAKLAQMQLAFERQEAGLDFILSDYWSVTSAGMAGTSGEDRKDRRGLTGSARLLQDVTRMDQRAFTTDRRKLQMSKTISLALHDPVAFQLFKLTGVLPFSTTHELFDRDFPGHYLRLIKRVRTTVIALVPPTQGIKATLSHTGISHAVVSSEGGALFDNRDVQRDPESVALTSPANDSGVFEMQEQPEMLLPFEGLGVAGSWEFRMPHAANAFHFGTIADVLITIEYTALDSPTYRQQVIQRLDNTVGADRPFSFRHQFADAWYDLHNPDQTTEPMVVRFRTRREDFAPNVADLTIEHVALYFARESAEAEPIEIKGLHFSEQGAPGNVGGPATTVNSIAGTRQGRWPALIGKSPVGAWTLAFDDTPEIAGEPSLIRQLFEQEVIEDILFVITFGGETPAWP